MKEEVNAHGCGRESDLIAFIYDELDSDERLGFRSHAQECLSCGSELTEFSNIHDSVVAWRNEALLGVNAPPIQAAAVVKSDLTAPGALTALRRFFDLSPLWLKGAVVFASALFCLFAVLAVARLREAPPPLTTEDPNLRKYSEQELNAVVDRRVQDELQRIKNSAATAPAPQGVASHQVSGRKAPHRSEVASTNREQNARRPLSKDERQQLAADLRLMQDPTEGGLDLLDDRINQ